MNELDRRGFLAAVGALSAAALLGGCGSGAEDATTPGSTAARDTAPSDTPTVETSAADKPSSPATSEVLLFHHAQGLTEGVLAFTDQLREAGHIVHTPDLLDGRTFDTLEDGVAYAREVGFDEVVERGVRAAEGLPAGVVYAGFSLGVMPAQKLAQTRAGARGALLVSACLPVRTYGSAWPEGVPVQVHAMDADPYFVDSGDLDAARALVAAAAGAELVLYPGSEHLFADSSLSSYDAEAAALLQERVLAFLALPS